FSFSAGCTLHVCLPLLKNRHEISFLGKMNIIIIFLNFRYRQLNTVDFIQNILWMVDGRHARAF
ncbi:MAG: hypothetical protein ACI90V_010111, partial [Bacillariaceae sp.]